MKILILGHKNHGKTAIGNLIAEILSLTYLDSSLYCCEHIVYPKLKDKYNYNSPKDCYIDRINHRMEWKRIINKYCSPSNKLTKEILKISDIYVGMRSAEEFEASKSLFNYIIYVRNFAKEENDVSMEIKFDRNYMVIFNNILNEGNTIEYVRDFLASIDIIQV